MSLSIRFARDKPKFALTPGVLLALECLLALTLALLFIGRESFWLDEALSVFIAKRSWPSMTQLLAHREANQGLYYIFLHFWLHLGSSEAIVRGLSAVFAVATVPVMYLLGKQLFDKRVGLMAGLLMATNGFWLQYAQEARAYSLVLLLTALSSYAFLRALEAPSKQRWACYAALSALAIYAHFFAGFVVFAQFTSLLLLSRRDIPWKALTASAVAIGVLLVPLAAFVLTAKGQLDWVAPPNLHKVLGIFVLLSGGRVLIFAYFLPAAAASIVAIEAWRRAKVIA